MAGFDVIIFTGSQKPSARRSSILPRILLIARLRIAGCDVIIFTGSAKPSLPNRRPINGRKWPYCKFRRGHAYAPGSAAASEPTGLWASAAPEVFTSELAGWCWARQTLMEKRALHAGNGNGSSELRGRLALAD